MDLDYVVSSNFTSMTQHFHSMPSHNKDDFGSNFLFEQFMITTDI